MSIKKEPKSRRGRVYRTIKLPVGLHEKLKATALLDSKKIYHLYEEIVNGFLIKNRKSGKCISYLSHQGKIKDISISLTKELVTAVKESAVADSVPETRIMFTAIMLYAEKNGLTD